ncbi:mxaD protein [Methylococcales bacterium]|nr:mxaD protein [Methylococcales bacterium]
MKKIAAFVSVALFAWGGAAHAHGGTRQKVVESVEINAAPDAVWNIIKDFGDAKWIPAVASSKSDKGSEKGAVRELTLKDGGVVKEELKELDAATHTLKYRVHEEPDCAAFPVNNYSATIAVTAAGAGSKVEWTSAAYRCFTPNNPPPGQDEKAAIEAMTCLSKEALANLKALAEKK